MTKCLKRHLLKNGDFGKFDDFVESFMKRDSSYLAEIRRSLAPRQKVDFVAGRQRLSCGQLLHRSVA